LRGLLAAGGEIATRARERASSDASSLVQEVLRLR
jgi:hypothetical protein